MAEELGRRIAENHYILVNGGMQGVMEASARGASQAGGIIIGILPGKNLSEANPYIDIPIATGIGYMRNSMVVLNSDILVAIDGEYGTLSEIAYAQIFSRPVLGLKTWNIRGVTPVSSPQEAIQCIQQYFAEQL